MREPRRESFKKRLSTKDRFVSILHGEREEEVRAPWYRERRNYLPMLAIFMFVVLWYVLRILHSNNYFENTADTKTIAPIAAPTTIPVEEPTPENPMDYEEAKRLLGELE